jgi:ABC-type transporter Mla MlaB component
MEDAALEVWVDVEHSPILVRLSGTLDQSTAINVVPVVKELMADEGRAVELHTPDLEVPDAGGTEALAELQRLVQHSGERIISDETLVELSVGDRSL